MAKYYAIVLPAANFKACAVYSFLFVVSFESPLLPQSPIYKITHYTHISTSVLTQFPAENSKTAKALRYVYSYILYIWLWAVPLLLLWFSCCGKWHVSTLLLRYSSSSISLHVSSIAMREISWMSKYMHDLDGSTDHWSILAWTHCFTIPSPSLSHFTVEP